MSDLIIIEITAWLASAYDFYARVVKIGALREKLKISQIVRLGLPPGPSRLMQLRKTLMTAVSRD